MHNCLMKRFSLSGRRSFKCLSLMTEKKMTRLIYITLDLCKKKIVVEILCFKSHLSKAEELARAGSHHKRLYQNCYITKQELVRLSTTRDTGMIIQKSLSDNYCPDSPDY